jgi:general L-amino acid transport system substrate-binding protein
MRCPFQAMAIIFLSFSAAICSPAPSLAGTLEEVQSRGYVRCAIGNRPVGDTRIGETGYEGFFPEFCRNVAIALFNDRNAVQLSPMLIRHGLQSISQGDVDIYVSNVTWTFSRDMELGLTPAAVLYYDGQGFMSHLGTVNGPLSAHQGARVCVSRSTTTIANLRDYIAIHELDWEVLAFESSEGRNDAFFSRQCDLLTTDALVLASLRATAVDNPANYVLHREIISKEPLVAYVKDDDMAWGNLVRWTVNATILAEEKGITQANYHSFLTSEDPAVLRLLGEEATGGTESIGLDPLWARNIIASSGNYGEIFDRYLGKDSAIGVVRGANKLWSDGGLMFSPPFR